MKTLFLIGTPTMDSSWRSNLVSLIEREEVIKNHGTVVKRTKQLELGADFIVMDPEVYDPSIAKDVKKLKKDFENADLIISVLSPASKNHNIPEIVQSLLTAFEAPEKLIFAYMNNDKTIGDDARFSQDERDSLDILQDKLEELEVKCFDSLQEVADFLIPYIKPEEVSEENNQNPKE